MTERLTLPVLPLREVVLFPGVTAPIGAGRPGTLRAIEAALDDDRRSSSPSRSGTTSRAVNADVLYTIGTVARIGQIQRGLGGVQLLLQGEQRAIALQYTEKDGYLAAVVRDGGGDAAARRRRTRPSWRCTARRASAPPSWARSRGLPEEVVQQVLDRRQRARPVRRPRRRLHRHHPAAAAGAARDALRRGAAAPRAGARAAPDRRARRAGGHQVAGPGGAGRAAARDVPARAAQGDPARSWARTTSVEELEELREKLDELELPEEARKEVERELGRLERIGRESMEAQVIRTYLECIAELPWNERSEDHLDLNRGAGDPRRGPLRARRREGPRAGVPRGAAAARSRSSGRTGAATAGCRRGRPRRPSRRRRARPSGRRAVARSRRSDAEAREQAQGPDPALRRPAGRRQDVDRQVDRARDGAGVRAHLARRRARRGRHPRPPAHLRRRHARSHHPGHEAGGHQEPGLPARRGRQARRVVPGRPGVARCSRCSTRRRTTRSPITTSACRST